MTTVSVHESDRSCTHPLISAVDMQKVVWELGGLLEVVALPESCLSRSNWWYLSWMVCIETTPIDLCFQIPLAFVSPSGLGSKLCMIYYDKLIQQNRVIGKMKWWGRGLYSVQFLYRIHMYCISCYHRLVITHVSYSMLPWPITVGSLCSTIWLINVSLLYK